MSAPLRDDDHQARAELEADCVRAEREYAIQRAERLHDFAPAARTPQAPLGEADDSGLDIPSSGLPARVSPVRARVTSLLRRIFTPARFAATGERRRVGRHSPLAATFFAPGSLSRSRHPLGADGGAGGRNLGQAGPATTSTKGEAPA